MKTLRFDPRSAARLALLGLSLAGFSRPAVAEPRNSPHYSQASEDFSGGGAPATSPAYSNTGDLAVISGEAESPTYAQAGGFQAAAQDSGPSFTLPTSPVVVEATGPNGAVVTFTPTASDEQDGPLPVTALPASGSIFPLGDTLVTVKATDSAANAAVGSFLVRVTDSTPPTLSAPGNSIVHATTPAGAEVVFMPTATDAVGVTALDSLPPSGTFFPVGTTPVTVMARDAAGNVRFAQFTITVTPLTNLERWRYSFFGSAEAGGLAADDADPDGDGVSNLLEFAFGTDPQTSGGSTPLHYGGTFAGGGSILDRGQPTVMMEPTRNGVDVRALYVRRRDFAAVGIAYAVQFSADLTTWVTSGATPTVLADDGEAQIVSVPYPASVGKKKAQFFRVVVTLP